MHPPYYRGCWHGVSRCFLRGYRPYSSPLTELYNPRAFITHAALLDQAFAHCPIFLTAASRRSLGRVSVPVWLVNLSIQLPVVALVGHYLTNKLIGKRFLSKRIATLIIANIMGNYLTFRQAMPLFETDTNLLLTRSPLP